MSVTKSEQVKRWTIPQRVAVGVVGLIVVVVGLVAWSLETEYGGNAVAGSEFSNGVERVFDIVDGALDAEGHPVTTIVFEGTPAEAQAYMTQRWSEGRNYTLPGLVIAIGGLSFLGAFIHLPRRTRFRKDPG